MTRYNLTAEQIKQLSDEECRLILVDLATQLVGHDRWVTDLADMLGLERRTVQMWKGGDRRVPTLAIVALIAIHDRKQLAAFHRAFRDLHDMAERLG